MKRQQKKPAKHAMTSATQTGTTPAASPSRSQTSEKEPEFPMDTSIAQTSLALVTATASPLTSRPSTPGPIVNPNASVDELISKLDKEPLRASNYGKIEPSDCIAVNRPQRTKKVPTRLGCAIKRIGQTNL